MKKHAKLGGVLAVTAALALTACGGGSASGPESQKAQESSSDISKLVSNNPKDVSELDDGGTVTLPVGSLGPDFNLLSNNGGSADTRAILAPFNMPFTHGCWDTAEDGKVTPNKDFCEDVTSETKDGKQTITIKVNEKAVFNDGTPFDAEAFINTWKINNGKDKAYDIVSAGGYEYIDSVKAGSSAKEVIVTTTQPVYPLDALFNFVLHPKINSPEIYNNGFVDDLHPEWAAGPFKVEKLDTAAQTLTLVRNEKWWGAKPALEKVVFRQLESSAQIAAFKNGEIDGVQANTLTPYKQLDGTANSEVRRGQRLFAGGLNLNAKRSSLTDVAVREAVFTAVDRAALQKVRFNGLNWEEEISGSMMAIPFEEFYQDNYPVTETGTEAAKKVLQDAGYTLNGEVFEKDGKKVSFKITNFGDDPTTLAIVQTLQKQLKDAGMDVGIDQRGSADFGKVVGSREFDLTISGYTVSNADTTEAVKQFYDSKTNENELGDAELDKKIQELQATEDDLERNKLAMEVEKEHMAKYFSMGVVFNGPQIFFARTGLANYGASLFASLSGTPDWTTIGWVKGSDHS